MRIADSTSSYGNGDATELERLLRAAIERRRPLFAGLAETDCYRMFHGITEGAPGLAIDRYGPVLLIQTWRAPLSPDELDTITAVVAVPGNLTPVWNHRGDDKTPFDAWHTPVLSETVVASELGVRYDVRPRHRGRDPLLFLDLRALRRQLRDLCAEKSVLNLFAYTCGVGVCAVTAGASEVWNVDFARSAIDVGKTNVMLNQIDATAIRFIQQDVLCVSRQLAGLDVGLRRGQPHNYDRVAARTFDITVLDPPRWATSRFGAVDVVRDYPTLFKPALLATRLGGTMLVTNHHPAVSRDNWVDVLRRCAVKAGRAIHHIELIEPEADFPSFDGTHPLKIAQLSV